LMQARRMRRVTRQDVGAVSGTRDGLGLAARTSFDAVDAYGQHVKDRE